MTAEHEAVQVVYEEICDAMKRAGTRIGTTRGFRERGRGRSGCDVDVSSEAARGVSHSVRTAATTACADKLVAELRESVVPLADLRGE
jgi:hypothetical protein